MEETQTISLNETIIFNENKIKILDYLGILNPDIYYFKVTLENNETKENNDNNNKLALLRISHTQGNLQKEIELRKELGNYGLFSQLIDFTSIENLVINTHEKEQEKEQVNNTNSEINENQQISKGIDEESQTKIEPQIEEEKEYLQKEDLEEEYLEEEYLEEEYYPETEFSLSEDRHKLLVLSEYPDQEKTLAEWLKNEHTDLEYLAIIVQICQCAYYLVEKQWYCLDLFPEFITIGTPIKFFDLTNIYPQETVLQQGFIGRYSSPELTYNNQINSANTSYTIGALMYQMFYRETPNHEQLIFNKYIPCIEQIIKVCLSHIPEERYEINQLLKLLINSRNKLKNVSIQWHIAHESSLGLSLKRLTNEDSYGFKTYTINNHTIILGAIADGMGGLAQGEVASKLAIQTLLEMPLTADENNIEKMLECLLENFKQANYNISKNVKEGGTTLSAIVAIDDKLIINHVGDSRIYLLRKEKLTQLSEDHSLVNMLVMSQQITEAESRNHPDRNVLIKSLGAKPVLSNGYIQTLEKSINQPYLNLENNDILILCSDGVWDLVSDRELIELFSPEDNLENSVKQTINKVLERGAFDNATLLAFKCKIKSYKF